MNLSELLEKYKNNPLLLQLVDRLHIPISEGERLGVWSKIFLKNLQDSSAEFILSSVYSTNKTTNFNLIRKFH